AASGRFLIAYERQFSGDDWDIFASQYGAGGVLQRSNIHINFDSNPEHNPSVSMDRNGNAVVAYQRFIGGDHGIYANPFTFGTGAVSSLITVQDVGGIDETNPSVAMARAGGQFVVAYDTPNGVQVTEMGSDNSQLATLGPVTGSGPAISIDAYGRYLVTY